jgi:predicted DNA-binding transcriptional regulator YafY
MHGEPMEVFLFIVGGVVFWWLFIRDGETKRDDQNSSGSVNSGRSYANTTSSGSTRSTNFSSKSPTRSESSNQAILEKAIAEHLDVKFRYTDKYGEITSRTITPTLITPYEFESGSGHTLCVEGFCHLRKADRVFALKRISALKLDS